MAKKNVDTSDFARARDELFSHILRCDVLQAAEEHQRDWFDDTMEYMRDEYPRLTDEQLTELRTLGERYCQPVRARSAESEVQTANAS